jgi:hypothetical protein
MAKSSLRRELVIPITVLVIGVSAAIAWVSMKAGTDAVETLTQRVLLDVVNRISVAAEKHLDGALIALESVAPNPLSVPEEQPFSTNVHVLEQKLWLASLSALIVSQKIMLNCICAGRTRVRVRSIKSRKLMIVLNS